MLKIEKKGGDDMSMYLFDEQPIVANKALARALGLNEALVLQQINYWIEINKKSGKNYHDEKYWTYNSIRAWQENNFDYISVDTIKRTWESGINDPDLDTVRELSMLYGCTTDDLLNPTPPSAAEPGAEEIGRAHV